MANGGTIQYSIGFNVDKAGLNQLKSSLMEIRNLTSTDLLKINNLKDIDVANQQLEAIQRSAGQLEGALERAFNVNLGTLNISKFNQELQKINLKQIHADLSLAGTAGQKAFRDVTANVLTTNMKLRETHTILDKIGTTMGNTIKWGLTSGIWNKMTGELQQAYGYVKALDGSLNDIRIVTGASADEMDRFAVKANDAAKKLGQGTKDYTNAALIYYQQGKTIVLI